MITTERKSRGKYKTLRVFEDNKLIGEASEHFGWLCIECSNDDTHSKVRKAAMENLWWLLHRDDEDLSWEDAWQHQISRWDRGKGMEGPTVNSLFYNNEEKQIALNSINNK